MLKKQNKIELGKKFKIAKAIIDNNKTNHCSISAMHTPPQTIIFDLGGVLLREAESTLHKVDHPIIKRYINIYGSLPKIFNKTFAFLTALGYKDVKRDWLLGKVNGHYIVEIVQQHIDDPAGDTFFNNSDEKELVRYCISYILLPDLLTEITELMPEALSSVQHVQACGINIGIISNWDPTSFTLIQKKFPELFSLFAEDYIIIPCQVGAIKPEPEIYYYALQQMNVSADHCFFIDDSPTNVDGATRAGIHGIVHQNWQNTIQQLTTILYYK
jgi:HAD superfamily hydrolase (TIGR01509 family)